MAETENQAGKTLPWDIDQFNQVINEHSKKVREQVAVANPVPELGIPPATGGPEIPFKESLVGKTVGGVVGGAVDTYNLYRNVSRANTPGQEAGALAPETTVIPPTYTGSAPWRKPNTGIETSTETPVGGGIVPTAEAPVAPGIVPMAPTKVGGSPPIGMRQAFYNEAPEAPGGAFTGGGGAAGVVPINAPSGGGIGGFVDQEMERINKDKAEYAASRAKLEEEQLAGLGPAGQDKLKQRIAAMAPYLEGVSKGRKAKIMAGYIGEHLKSEDEMRKAIVTGRQGLETATVSAGIRAGASRDAAIMRANTEAQKMGIDVAKLGIETQKLGLQAGNIQSQMRLREAQVNDMMMKTGQIEPMKLALQEAKNSDERTKIQRTAWDQANTDLFKQTLASIKAKYQYTPDSPEAIKETQQAFQNFTAGHQVGAIRFAFKGQVEGDYTFDGTKWIKTNNQ